MGKPGLYDQFSFPVFPLLGTILAGDRASYQYLVESIRRCRILSLALARMLTYYPFDPRVSGGNAVHLSRRRRKHSGRFLSHQASLSFYLSSFPFDSLPYLSSLVPLSLLHLPLIPARARLPHVSYATCPMHSRPRFFSYLFHPLSFAFDTSHSDHTIPDVEVQRVLYVLKSLLQYPDYHH
jgi:hypothetical protein